MNSATILGFLLSMVLALSVEASPQLHLLPLKVEDLTSRKTEKLALKAHGDRLRVLFFWATWCEHCLTWVPALQEAQSNPRVEITWISTDAPADKGKVPDMFRQKFHLMAKKIFWLSPEERVRLGIEKIPAVAILRPDGQVDTLYEESEHDKIDYFRKNIRIRIQASAQDD